MYRNNNLKRRYNITLEEYNILFEKQNGKCAICNKKQINKQLAVDHDHNTGKVRGLLCQNCNTGIGKFKDNPKLLLKAKAYLEERI